MIMDTLVKYYVRQAGGSGDNGVGPIYVTPLFVQRGCGIGSFLSGLFRAVSPILWSGAKNFGKATLKALGKEARYRLVRRHYHHHHQLVSHSTLREYP